VTWPCTFDLDVVWLFNLHTFNAHTNFSQRTIMRSWFMGDSIWSHYLHMELSQRIRRVTWPIIVGQKCEIPEPNLRIHFVTFRALRRRLSHVIGEKLRFPTVKATKFTTHAQYHVTKTTRNNFLTPNCLFTIQLIWATMTIKASLYWSIPMLKRFSAAKSSKSVPKMAFFRKFKGLNIKYSYLDPKSHFLTRHDVF